MQNINVYVERQKKKYYEKDHKFENLIQSSSSNKFTSGDYPINTFLSTQATVSNLNQRVSNKNLLSSNAINSIKVDKYSKLVPKKVVQSSKDVTSFTNVNSLKTLPGVS